MHTRQADLLRKARALEAAIVPHSEQLSHDVPKHLANIAKMEADMKSAYSHLQSVEILLDALLAAPSVGLDKDCSEAIAKMSKQLSKVWEGWVYPQDFNDLRETFKKKAR